MQLMSEHVRAYMNSGGNHEQALRDNVDMFKLLKLRPRTLVDVSKICLKSDFLGVTCDMPLGISPTAMQKLVSADGELNSIRAAKAMNTVFTLSTISNTSMEALVSAVPESTRVFQLCVPKSREATLKLIHMAEANGFLAIAVTVDAPELGTREQDQRNKFSPPANLRLELLERVGTDSSMETTDGSGVLRLFAEQIDKSLSWDFIEWLRGQTRLEIIVKGLTSAEDARLAAAHGVKHIWVSNHGGRQLSDIRSTVEILPEIVKAVKHLGVKIYVDGGIRFGHDVFKCLALGADFVFLGRPMIWAQAVAGLSGQIRALQILKEELRKCMVLCGVTSIKGITRQHVVSYLPTERL
jgi:(S)-2-hydroxy-acid oxidase